MRRSPETSNHGRGLDDAIWTFDSLQYETICTYLGLSFRSDALREKVARYLRHVAKQGPRVHGFERFLADMRVQPFGLGLLDIWTRLWVPHHPWRYKLNAVIAIHECDARGYQDLCRSPKGAIAAAVSFAAIGVRYVVGLGLALGWIAWLYTWYWSCTAREIVVNRGGYFDGKTVLVTGVSRGLGSSLTRQLLAHGARVIGLARDAGRLEALRKEADQRGWAGQLKLLSVDVGKRGTVSSAIEAIGVTPQEIDIAIANAGVKLRSEALVDLDAVRRTFETNVFGALETVSAVLPAMVERQSGQIVFVSSLGRWHGMKAAQGYNASKAALSNLGESLRIDLAARGIRGITVTLVEPGLIRTDMVDRRGLQKFLSVESEEAVRHILLGVSKKKAYIRFPFHMRLMTSMIASLPASLRIHLLTRL